MTRRTFPIKNRLLQSNHGGILDVPSTAILRYASPEELVQTFSDQWGIAPEGVMLPVTNADGLLFAVEGLSESMSQYAYGFSRSLKDYQDLVHSFAEQGLDIYLSVDPTMTFVRTDPLHIIDIVGDASRHLCIANSRSQEVIGAVMGTGVDIVVETTKETRGKLTGVVIDAVNLWPMGGKKNLLELTCFCPSCDQYFTESHPGLVRRFKTSPNPWHLVLEATASGISHVNEIRLHYGPEDLVGLGRQKGFDKAYDDDSLPFLVEQAKDVLEYIEGRHNQSVFAVKEVFDVALEGLDSPPRRIILTEGMYYSWTAGLQLERLDVERRDENVVPYDEVWFDAQSYDRFFSRVDFRSYMCRRSRYYLDHFFDLAASASDAEMRATTGVGRFPPAQLREILRTRLSQALGSLMTGQTSLCALPDMKNQETPSRRVGFVAVALTKDIGEKFIGGLRIAPGLADEDPQAMIGNVDQLLKMLERPPTGDGD